MPKKRLFFSRPHNTLCMSAVSANYNYLYFTR